MCLRVSSFFFFVFRSPCFFNFLPSLFLSLILYLTISLSLSPSLPLSSHLMPFSLSFSRFSLSRSFSLPSFPFLSSGKKKHFLFKLRFSTAFCLYICLNHIRKPRSLRTGAPISAFPSNISTMLQSFGSVPDYMRIDCTTIGI